MPTGSRPRDREAGLVSLGLALALAVAGLLGLVEKGPVVPALHLGSSPLSPLSYGTSSLYEIARSKYDAVLVAKPWDLAGMESSRCVLVVVSPTVPITRSEAAGLLGALRGVCRSLAVLVADEGATSNGLLEALNSSIRIVGNRVGVPHSGGLSLHPRALLRLGGRTITVTLDLASEVTGGAPSGFTLGLTLRPGEPAPPAPSLRVVVVASEEVVGGVHVYALGDGSVLVNQAIDSGDPTYRELAEGLLDYLCAGSGDCAVIFDARHYRAVNPLELLGGEVEWLGELAGPRDLLYVVLAAAIAALHPAVWLPPLLRAVDESLSRSVLYGLVVYADGRYARFPHHPAAYAVILLAAALLALPLCRRWGSTRDRPLPEQLERDVYVAAGLREAVLRGSVRLEPGDFANLYHMVDAALRSVLGVGLSDESLPEVLGHYVGRARALEYWRGMNRLYRRATGRTLRPLIVSWRRAVLRYLEESEGVLGALGESLESALAPERLLAGVVDLGGRG